MGRDCRPASPAGQMVGGCLLLKAGLLFFRRSQPVFKQRYAAQGSAGRNPQLHFLYNFLNNGQGIVFVNNHDIAAIPRLRQNLQTDGVEGSYSHSGDGPLLPEMLFQAGTHLAGGLVGKSDCGYLRGMDAAFFHQVGDAADQGFGFARSWAGNHGNGRAGGGNGLPLLPVQIIGNFRSSRTLGFTAAFQRMGVG